MNPDSSGAALIDALLATVYGGEDQDPTVGEVFDLAARIERRLREDGFKIVKR